MNDQDVNLVKISETAINNPSNSLETVTGFGALNADSFGAILGVLIGLVIFLGVALFIYAKFIKK